MGWIQPSFLGWVEPISLFGCTSNFEDGVNSSHVWLKKLGIGVGWQFNSVATGIGLHFSSGTLDFLEFNQGWIRKSFSLALLHQEPCKRNQIGFLPFLLLSSYRAPRRRPCRPARPAAGRAAQPRAARPRCARSGAAPPGKGARSRGRTRWGGAVWPIVVGEEEDGASTTDGEDGEGDGRC